MPGFWKDLRTSFIQSLPFKLILYVIKAFLCLRGLCGPRFRESEEQTRSGLLNCTKCR